MNEIDLVAVNEADHEMVIGEAKRNPGRIHLHELETKANVIAAKKKGWKIDYIGLFLKDMED